MNAFMDTVIEEIYQAAVDPAAFPRMFESLCGFLDASHGFLLLLNERSLVAHTHNLNPETQGIYNERYSEQDPWYNAAIERGVRGQIMTGQELKPIKELRHTDFYQDILVPDRVQDIMSITIARPDSWSVGLSFQRSTNEPLFDRRDKALLGSLLPHLGRMIRMRCALESRIATSALTDAAADRFTFGLIVLNQEGRIVFANRAAETLLTSNDGLHSRNGQLSAHHGDRRTLNRAIGLALGDGDATPIGSEIAIRRSGDRLPYTLQIMPIAPDRHESILPGAPLGARGAIVTVTDPERTSRPSTALLRQLFGLTPTEAACTLALAEGKSIKHIADELGISSGTVRWHAGNIRQKTGTRRQSELARLLAGITPATNGGDPSS